MKTFRCVFPSSLPHFLYPTHPIAETSTQQSFSCSSSGSLARSRRPSGSTACSRAFPFLRGIPASFIPFPLPIFDQRINVRAPVQIPRIRPGDLPDGHPPLRLDPLDRGWPTSGDARDAGVLSAFGPSDSSSLSLSLSAPCLCAFSFLPALRCVVHTADHELQMRILVQVEGLLTELIFEHALRVRVRAHTPDSESPSPSSSTTLTPTTASTEPQTAPGTQQGSAVDPAQISNLVTTDLRNVTNMSDFLMLLFYMPVSVVLSVVFLWVVLGWRWVSFLWFYFACKCACNVQFGVVCAHSLPSIQLVRFEFRN
jgi:hypothetical protein